MTGFGVWFYLAVSAWEGAHPDADDHGVAVFVGLMLVVGSGFCALRWLLPAVLLVRGPPAGARRGCGDAAGAVTEGTGVAGMILSNRRGCVRSLKARPQRAG
ncbi:hypothetical protein [Streptacidiphilus sp. MAP12-33]|uniref:hypothetical protein n=1 Tax=Streptacidiphilus sp. MAP12-33 TaxID=3156266 RepID=UPI003515B58C